MADAKITDLPELEQPPDNNDYFVIVDVSDTSETPTGKTKKIKKSNVVNNDLNARSVNTAKSLTGGGDLSMDRTLELVNDNSNPGINKVYGTDGLGIKGWQDENIGIPSGGTINQFLQKQSSDDYDATWITINKATVGLSNVNNTTDADKPVSTATQTELDNKVPITRTVNSKALSSNIVLDNTDVGAAPTSHTHAQSDITNLTTDLASKKTDSMATNKLLGRGTAGTGTIEEITLGTNLSLSGTTLNATGGGIADPGSNGILARTALNTTVPRTITGTTNQITVTNGNGVSGNPTLSLPQNIHTGASPTFAGVTTIPSGSSPTLASPYMGGSVFSTTYQASSNAGLYVRHASDTAVGDRPIVGALRSRGTLDTPTAVANGDELFSFLSASYDGTALQYTAEIKFKADGAVSAGTVPTSIGFYNGNNGAARNLNFIINSDGTSKSKQLAPFTNSTYTLGTSSLYWKETYTNRLYLNSTAYLDGSTAGALVANGKLTVNSAVSWPFEVNNNSLNTNFLLKSTIAASTSNRTRTQYQLQSGTGNASALDITAWFSDITPSAATSTFVFSAFETGSFYDVLRFDGRAATLANGVNISVGTTSGTKIGTATNQKLGFYNATPVVQPSSTPANATDLATAITLVNDLKSKLVTLGLIA